MTPAVHGGSKLTTPSEGTDHRDRQRRRMVLVAVGLIGLQHQAVQAMFAAMTDDELLQRSDLIVVGEW